MPPNTKFLRDALNPFAAKYIWWKTPDEAVARSERIVAQVMDIGDYDDVQALAHVLGDDVFRDVLIHAEIGQFSGRSWAYWHIRLGICSFNNIPTMPARRFA